MDPISAINASISSSIRLFEATYQLKAVDEQTTDLLFTTRHVTNNVKEARRLRRLKAALLNTGERSWMDGIIDDAENALHAIAELIEPARVDKSTKEGINFAHRVMWVFRDNPKVQDKHARLNVCHQSLMTVISCLYAKDVVVVSPVGDEVKDDKPPPYDPGIEGLMNWKNQRRRKSSMALKKDALGSSTASSDPDSSSNTTLSPTSTRSSLIPDRSNQESTQYSGTSSSSQTNTTGANASPNLPEIDSSSAKGPIITPHASYEGADGLQICEPYSPDFQPWKPQSQQVSTGTSSSAAFPSSSPSTTTLPSTTRSYSEGEGARYLRSEDGLQNYRDRAQTLATVGASGAMPTPERNPFPVELPNSQDMEPMRPSIEGRSVTQQSFPRRGRGKRNWLAYHATRSDIGHNMG